MIFKEKSMESSKNELPRKLYISNTDYIDFGRKEVVTESETFILSGQESCLLEYFVYNKNHVLSHEQIIVYLEIAGFGTTTCTNLIKNMRQKGLKSSIVTRKGNGYMFEISEELFKKSEDEMKWESKEKTKEKSENKTGEGSEKKEDGKQGETVRRKKSVVILTSIVLVAIVLGAVFGVGFKSFKQNASVCHVTLKRPAAITEEDLKILEERIKIFADGNRYSMDVNDDKIELYLPEKAFDEKDVEYVLNCYLTRAIKLYAFNPKGDVKEHLFIDRSDIEKFSVLDGPLEGVDATKYEIATTDYKYFSIVLKDEFVDENKEILDKFGENLSFAQDAENNSFYNYYTFPQEDGKTFYILNNDLAENFVKLLEYNLTHNALSVDLNDLIIDINSKATWQAVKNTENVGKNQVNYDEFSKGTISILYSSYSELSEGQSVDAEKALKQRLDALGDKYAFGSYSTDGKVYYVVKIDVDKINEVLMQLLPEKNDYIIRGGLSEYSFGRGGFAITKSSVGNKLSFVPDYYDEYKKEKLSSFVNSLDAEGDVYLTVNDIPFICTTAKDIDVEKGTITFDRVCEVEVGKLVQNPITDEYAYILDLLDTISKTSESIPLIKFEDYQFNVNKRGNLPSERDFNLQYDYYDEALINKVKEICPTAKATILESELYVSLNLPVDDKLVDDAIELSKKIYEAVDLKNSVLSGITVYFIDENNDDMERGRIFFMKKYQTSYSDGGIRVHGIFTGGRLERFKDEYKNKIENDEALNKLLQDEYSWTYSSAF